MTESFASSSSKIEGRPAHRVIVQAGLPRENHLPKAGVGQGLGTGLGAIDISGMVKRIRVIETIGAPNATFELGCTFQTLSTDIPSLDWSLNQFLVPQNICEIWLGGEPGWTPFNSVIQGVITRVYGRTALSEDGQPTREVVIAGESWGNLLVNHDLPAHYFSARFQGDKELARLKALDILLDGPCGLVEQKLFEAIFTKQTNVLQLKTNDIFALDIDQSLLTDAAGVTYQGNIWMRQGKLWTIMRSLADEPWNELFATWNPYYVPQGPADGKKFLLPATTEQALNPERKFVIRLRHRPFDIERWPKLYTHIVSDEEIRYQEWALADDERLNWISVEPLALMQAAGEQHLGFIQFMYSRLDLDSAEAHGARHRSFPTAYNDRPRGQGTILTDPHELERYASGQGEAAQLSNDRVQLLWNWYAINHQLSRGTVVCRGRPEIHVGTRFRHQKGPSAYFVREEDERLDAYIETVVQDYLDGHHYWTHLALTRGQPHDRMYVPWVDGKRKQRGGGPVKPPDGSAGSSSKPAPDAGGGPPGSGGPDGGGPAGSWGDITYGGGEST